MHTHKSLWFAGYAFLTVFLIMSCRSNRSSDSNDAFNRIAPETLGADYGSFPRATNEFVLFIKHISDEEIRQANRFIIVETSTATLIEDKHYIPGYVKWKSDYEVEYLSMPGIIKENEDLSDYIKIIPVRKAKH
jgi:hypothetical protein